MLNYYGQEVTKPHGFNPIPKIAKTIIPVQRAPLNLWGEIIRAEHDAIKYDQKSPNKDCELVTLYYLDEC